MDKLNHYRNLIHAAFAAYVLEMKNADSTVETQVIEDSRNDHYLILMTGWENRRRVYLPVFHLDLKAGKILVQQNLSEFDIVGELEARGVPKEDIDLFLGNIPEDSEVTSKGLAGSLDAPLKQHPLIESPKGKGGPRGINTKTETETETETEKTTTTETNVVVVGQNNNQETSLELGELAEPHRALLLEIAEGFLAVHNPVFSRLP